MKPITFHAASSVSLPPVGCTVLGAPCSRDRRAALVASVRPDQPRPRHPRCARLSSTAQLMRFRGHSPRTIFYGRTDVIRHPTPGGRGSPPLRGLRLSPTLHQPLSHGAKRRDSSPFRGAEGVGAARRRRPSSLVGRALKPAPTRASKRAKRTGPRTGPFCAEAPAGVSGLFHGQIAQQRAGKPTPSRSLGKEQMIIAPVGGHWSRLRMTSIWKRSTSRMYCSPG